MKDQLTVSELKNYLGTGLRVYQDPVTRESVGIKNDFPLLKDFGTTRLEFIKPICYRLQDLDKFIDELGFVPIEELAKILYNMHPEGFKYPSDAIVWLNLMYQDSDYREFPYWMLEKLFQWHFWVFDQRYFEKGLIIDKLKKG